MSTDSAPANAAASASTSTSTAPASASASAAAAPAGASGAASSGPRVTISAPGANGAAGPRRPSANAPFHPPPETSTYRDLLLFEERLKMNAHMLRRRRRRYRIFLYCFIAAFLLMAYRLMVLPPENIVLLRGLQAVTVVVFITLALFFASGMHEEKIRYAHAYINHSNKALRPLNMYFNVRRAPASFLSFLPLPASLRPAPPPMKATTVPGRRPLTSRRVSTSQMHPGHMVMAQIPPSTNPRGELIFSSRVDPHFEEGYKRYRTAFERRREERAREEAKAAGPWFLRMFRNRNRTRSPSPLTHRRGSSSAASPPGSRRGTPEPTAAATTGSMRAASPPRRRRSRTPPPPKEGPRHERAESYSFVDAGLGDTASAKAGAK